MAVLQLVDLYETLDKNSSWRQRSHYYTTPQSESSQSLKEHSLLRVMSDASITTSIYVQERETYSDISTPHFHQNPSPSASPSFGRSSNINTRYTYLPESMTTYFNHNGSASLASLAMSTPSTPHKLRQIRRLPSMVDISLHAERAAVGPEYLGLGLFEPRPHTQPLQAADASFSQMEFSGRSMPPTTSAVFDGIFEVLEKQQ